MAHANRTALITGGCGGLGLAIAEVFLSEGANVVVCDIRSDLVTSFANDHPSGVLALTCDITDDLALDDLFDRAEQTFGRVDYVINSAGMMDKFDPIGDLDRTLWDRVLALNLTAPAMVTKRAVNKGVRSIVNVGSVASVRGFVNGAAYTASKHGLIGLTKNTAAFYGVKSGVRCNAIMPGGMKTNVIANLGQTFNDEGAGFMAQHYPTDGSTGNLYVETEKVAKLVSYLCSDAADVVNGATITVDGGWTAAF